MRLSERRRRRLAHERLLCLTRFHQRDERRVHRTVCSLNIDDVTKSIEFSGFAIFSPFYDGGLGGMLMVNLRLLLTTAIVTPLRPGWQATVESTTNPSLISVMIEQRCPQWDVGAVRERAEAPKEHWPGFNEAVC